MGRANRAGAGVKSWTSISDLTNRGTHVPFFFGSSSSADHRRDTKLLTQHDRTRVPLFRVASRTGFRGAATRTQKMKLKKKTKNLTSFIPPSTPMVGFDQLPGGEKKKRHNLIHIQDVLKLFTCFGSRLHKEPTTTVLQGRTPQ